MMEASPAQRVEMIPIEKVNILNPRSRNANAFEEFVENIAQIGLKRPITVTRRGNGKKEVFDLVCGQGRLEAYIALGEKNVPALIVSAEKEDCLVASLVENCARRHHNAFDLLQDIRGMEERGYSQAEIAKKTGLAAEYIRGISKLISQGEQRLLRSVEGGQIPLTVALKIAEVSDHEVQAALSNAYELGLLKGKKLLAARRVIESRRRLGKGLHRSTGKNGDDLSAKALMKAYEQEAARKQALIDRAHSTRDHLLLIIEALRRLFNDDAYVAVLEAESLNTLPSALAGRLGRTQAPGP